MGFYQDFCCEYSLDMCCNHLGYHWDIWLYSLDLSTIWTWGIHMRYKLDFGCRNGVLTGYGLENKMVLSVYGIYRQVLFGHRLQCKVQATAAHLQAVPHLYSRCPVCTTSLQPISILYPIFTAHVQRVLHLYCIHTNSALSLQHLYCPYPVSTPSLLSMSSQDIISPANIQSIYHLYCPFLVRVPYLLYMSNTYCLCPVIVSYHQPMSSQQIRTYYLYIVSAPPFLPMVSRQDGVLILYGQITLCTDQTWAEKFCSDLTWTARMVY